MITGIASNFPNSFIKMVVIVIVIVMSKHQDGESTPDGGTPQRENLCAHAAQTLFTRTKHTRKQTAGGGCASGVVVVKLFTAHVIRRMQGGL